MTKNEKTKDRSGSSSTISHHKKKSTHRHDPSIERSSYISNKEKNSHYIIRAEKKSKKRPIDTARKVINELNNPKMHLFGSDVNTKMAKQFVVCTYDWIYKFIRKCKNPHIYEYMERYNKVKLHVDVDIDKKYIKGDRNDTFDFYIKNIIDLINKQLLKHKITNNNIIILKSSNKTGKLSGHIIYTNVVFHNIEHMKLFFVSMDSELVSDGIIDPRAMKIGAFRTLWSSKMGKPNTLFFYKGVNYTFKTKKQLFLDTLNCNINQPHKLIKLNIKYERNTTKLRFSKKYHLSNQTNNKFRIPADDLKKYVDLLSKKRADGYLDWIYVGICIYNCNPSAFTVWDEWSKQSSKYDRNIAIYKWNSFRSGNMGLGTLKRYARIDNTKMYNKLQQEFDPPLYKTINIHRRYLIEREDKIKYSTKKGDNYKLINKIVSWWNDDKHKCLGIDSSYDTGKTTLLQKVIKTFDPYRILWISHRQSFSYEIEGKFRKLGFANYLNGNFKANKLICQIESLHKIEDVLECNDNGELDVLSYDLVILDENTSLLNHYGSSTIEDKRDTFNLMETILHNSKKVIALDGDFDNRCYTYLHNFGETIIINNTCVNKERNMCLIDNKTIFDLNLYHSVMMGENIIICSMSSKIAKNYKEMIEKEYGVTVLLHTSKTDDKLKKELINIEKLWSKYKVVIYSPTVEAGCNFDIEHFDRMYCILSARSTSQRGFLQMCSRVRKLTNKDVFVYTNGFKFRRYANFYTYNETKQYLTETNRKACKKKRVYDKQRKMYVTKLDFDLYDEIRVYNEQERLNKESYYFIPLLIKLAEKKGYTIQHIPNIKNNTEKAELKVESVINELLETPDVDEHEMEKLLYKQMGNAASYEDKLKIEKHMIKKNFGIDRISFDFLSAFYGKTYMLYNLITLIDDRNIKNFDIYEKLEKVDYDTQNRKDKNMYVREIIKMLGYNNIFDTKKIPRETLINNYEKVKVDSKFFKNLHHSLPLFGLTKKPRILSVKSCLGFVNKILSEYGMSMKAVKKNKKINGKVKTSHIYHLVFYCNVHEFINYKVKCGFKIYNQSNVDYTVNKKEWNKLYFERNIEYMLT